MFFEGQGTLPFTYKIQLKEDATPSHPRSSTGSCPSARALETGIGSHHPIRGNKKGSNNQHHVCVKKSNGELRVCLDPKDLNDNIKREHCQIPTREEILSEMSGAQFFSKLDASHGFWQIRLNSESSKYCTFNTPFGRYCFLHLPFGIKSAPKVFH